MLLVLSLLRIFFRLVILHKTPKHAHLLVEFTIEIEIVELPEPQLAIVIIEALLGDPHQFGSVL